MRRGVAFLVAVEAALGVSLAVAINVATGGTLPAALTAYRSWAWPLVAVLSVVAVLVPLRRFALERPGSGSVRYSEGYRDQQRERVLDILDQRLKEALTSAPAFAPQIDLTLTGRHDAVDPLKDWLVPPRSFDPAGLGIREVFERLDRSLLILGAPGTGKSADVTMIRQFTDVSHRPLSRTFAEIE